MTADAILCQIWAITDQVVAHSNAQDLARISRAFAEASALTEGELFRRAPKPGKDGLLAGIMPHDGGDAA